jgi:hypothetical protein
MGMTIAQAESLKHELTDKYVVVQDGIAELRRFSGLTGQVKTVNMNGRALVQFDGPVDISWYDIDPSCLKIVAAPQPKVKHAEKPAAKAAPSEAPKKPAAGKSPLEMARSQGAAGAPQPAAKKLSPLELARQQGAGGKPTTPSEGKKLSPLELARQQGAGGKAPAAPEPAPAVIPEEPPVAATPAPVPAAAEPTPDAATPAPVAKSALTTPGSTAEIIALARQQGPAHG